MSRRSADVHCDQPFAASSKLEAAVRSNLKGLGYC